MKNLIILVIGLQFVLGIVFATVSSHQTDEMFKYFYLGLAGVNIVLALLNLIKFLKCIK